jgi:hypothetical protein
VSAIKAGLAALGIVGAMAAGVLGAGQAKADSDEFRAYGDKGDMNGYALAAELNYVGFGVTGGQATGIAYGVCSRRIDGVSSSDLEDQWIAQHDVRIAVAVVRGSEWHFCPLLDEPLYPSPPKHTLEPNPPGPPPPPAGGVDLNLGIPISHPTCDGTGIVVLGNAVTPGRYQADVQRLLADNPGASYLRTDQSCPSLRQATETGSPIYAVFRVAGRTPREVCSAVGAAGGNAYGKWLDTAADPSYVIPC